MNTLFLIKFGRKEHLLALKEKGEIFMNFHSSFKKADSNTERYDPLEGVKRINHLQNEKIYLKPIKEEVWKSLNMTKASYHEFPNTEGIYSYSLYFVSLEEMKIEREHRINIKMQEFGDHFLFIRSPRKFFERINKYLTDNKYEFCHQPINYFDEKVDQQDLTLFNKKETLKHQKEYRFLVKAKSNEYLKFNIAPLPNYCELYETKNLNDFILSLP
jgi:hypothetical protein